MNKIYSKTLSYMSVFIFALLFTGYGFSVQGGGMNDSGTSGMSANNTNIIGIDNFTFNPETKTINVGTTVTWVNHDDIPHLVVIIRDKNFQAPVLDTDQEFSYKFVTPGTYDYFCSLHPKMTGKIIVKQ
ncbi:MAG: cupredoxin family copper-binding protein [Thermodesulfobacteriota bacterium]